MKLDIKVAPGKHDKAADIDRQVNDKERVAAAMENETVRHAIEELIRERIVY
jgi:hypothetical protein